jgi:hypothetical protein
LFKNCVGYRGQKAGFTLSFGDELMNLLSRNMAQVKVFILQIKFPSLNLPGQYDIKICQVHVVTLEDEVTIVLTPK